MRLHHYKMYSSPRRRVNNLLLDGPPLHSCHERFVCTKVQYVDICLSDIGNPTKNRENISIEF